MPTRSWFIDTWAGEPTEAATSFDRCARFNFLRRQPDGRLQHPAETPSGRFAYGFRQTPALQSRVAALSGELRSRGFASFSRLGEGAEAFVVRTFDANGKAQAVRTAPTELHTASDPDRLPCADAFSVKGAGDGRTYNVTIAPVITQDASDDEVWAFKERQFERGHLCQSDFAAHNLGRHLGRVVLLDYGVALQPWTDPQLGGWGYAADLLYKVGQNPTLAKKPAIRSYAAKLAAGIAPMRHKDLDLLAQSTQPERIRIFG